MKQVTQSLQLIFLRLTFRILGWISPKRAASRAMQMMSTPRLFPVKEREQTMLEMATVSRRPYRAGEIQLYSWGNGPRTMLVVHGWEGRAGNYGGMIPSLVERDWSVFAFDAPSHGQSDPQSTSMFDFADCLSEVIQNKQFDAIVAHSFGCVATTIVLAQNQEHATEKLVFIASPNRFEDRLQQMVELFGLSGAVTAQLRKQLQRSTVYPIFDFSIADLGDQLNANKRLLLHDRNDQLSLFQWSQDIADGWSNVESATTQLIPIEGTGHNRILWDETTIQQIVAFLEDDLPI